ncbi:hypothetical protein [uncultured Ruthenibacterium sp.]|uniref:hypothetical protein n=1 Tax=uncultured Ruthenibacterium sp. TaxID=1905347 RepID=UPI00349E54C8
MLTELAEKMQKGFGRVKIVVCAACFLFYLLVVKLSGSSLVEMLLFFMCVAFYLYFPGRFFVWASGMGKNIPDFTAPLSILFGTGFLAALYCFGERLNLLWIVRLAPPVLGFFWILTIARLDWKLWFKSFKEDASRKCIVVLWSCLTALFALMVTVKNAHASVVGEILPNQDVLWNIGNAESFHLAFPPQDIRFSQVRLAYHYLTELTVGALSYVSGISCYDIFVSYIGPVVLAGLLCCLYQLGCHFYKGNKNKALFFTFSMFLFNCASLWTALLNGKGIFNNTNMLHLITNVNSQSTALIFISIFVVLFQDLAQRKFEVNFFYLATFLCSFFLVCFAKGPAAAIVACSFTVTMLLLLFRKPKWGRALLCFAGVLAIFLVIYFVIFSSGVNTSVHFGFETIKNMPPYQWLGALGLQDDHWIRLLLGGFLALFCMQPFQISLYLHGLPKDVKYIFHLPAERLLANGVTVGGFLAFFLFWHPSYSQLYFALIAIFFLNLLAVDQIDHIRGYLKKFVIGCGALGLATTVILVINFTGSGMRQLGRNLDIIPKYPYVSTVRSGDEEAMIWMRENTKQDAVFATNRIHTMANTNDGISSIYSALSGRQAYMEGYTYAITNMGVSEQVVAEKKRVNEALFNSESTHEEIYQLCVENGINYLVYSKQYAGDNEQLAAFSCVFSNDDVEIYEIT